MPLILINMNFRENRFICTLIHPAILLSLSLLLSGLTFSRAWAGTDTTWSVQFRLNMTHAIDHQIFNPDSDYVYVALDHGIEPMRLAPEPGNIYSATLFDELDSATAYNYKFRINDTLWETVHRSFISKPGLVTLSSWWNDEFDNYTTFQVDMTWATQSGLFNPVTDSVCIAGTMNNSRGFRTLQHIDTTLKYAITYSLEPASVHRFKYCINADSAGMELQGKPDRMVRVPDTILNLFHDFNNVNPSKRPMTFVCNMGYYIGAHHFDPSSSFVDVAGNFNNQGGNDVLFDPENDSIYSVECMLDTAWFQTGPLRFKFRIDGDWSTAELSGKPDRSYTFHDTIGNDPNRFYCYYNDLNPNIPTRPWAFDVAIQGLLIHKEILSGSYGFEDVNGAPEGISQYQWYRSDNAQGANPVAIDTAQSITYTIDTLDIGKWLVFEVTPVAAKTDSAVGLPVRVVSATPVGGVGIGESENLITKVFPNPCSDLVTVEARRKIDQIAIYNAQGVQVFLAHQLNSQTVRLPVGNLSPGFYFLKATSADRITGTVKLIRR